MANFSKLTVIIVALAMVAAWTVWASEQVEKGEAIQITGTVLKGGHLQDDKGQKYMLVQDAETLQLMSHVGAKVEIKGTLIERQEGDRPIKIQSYKVVNP